MLKQETLTARSLRHYLPRVGTLLFYGTVLTIIGFSELPPVSAQAFLFLRKQLFAGQDPVFQAPGAEFSVFKPSLPRKGTVSFIMDSAPSSYGTKIEPLYAAQNYLAPLILNPEPGEQTAILYCAKGYIADAYMRKNGYHLKVAVADGKGIAEKNP